MQFKALSLLLALTCGLVAAQELKIDTVHVPEACAIKTQNGDKLAMHYTGKLEDGSTFDSSRTRGQPFVFTLGKGMVIQGWDKGLQNMCIGEKRVLTIPSNLGYGDRGHPPVIPAKATLIFDVELLEIQNRKAEAAAESTQSLTRSSIGKKIDDMVAMNHCVIFSKSYCPYCKRAKQSIKAVAERNPKIQAPTIYEMDTMGEEGRMIQDLLFEKTQQRTVPNIFIGRRHIGGADAITVLQESGQLERLLVGASGITWTFLLLGGGGAVLLIALSYFGLKSGDEKVRKRS